MKKFALFAMLLGSTFVFGCEGAKTEPKKDTPPAAGTTDETKKDEGAKTEETKPAEGEKKTEEAPK